LGCVGGIVSTVVDGRLVGGNVVAGGAVCAIVVGGTGGSDVKKSKRFLSESCSITELI